MPRIYRNKTGFQSVRVVIPWEPKKRQLSDEPKEVAYDPLKVPRGFGTKIVTLGPSSYLGRKILDLLNTYSDTGLTSRDLAELLSADQGHVHSVVLTLVSAKLVVGQKRVVSPMHSVRKAMQWTLRGEAKDERRKQSTPSTH